MTAGVASLTALDAGSSLAMALGLQVLVGPGLGMICASARSVDHADDAVAAPNFLIMAPLPANDGRLIGNAMAFAAFARSFGQALGAVRPSSASFG